MEGYKRELRGQETKGLKQERKDQCGQKNSEYLKRGGKKVDNMRGATSKGYMGGKKKMTDKTRVWN